MKEIEKQIFRKIKAFFKTNQLEEENYTLTYHNNSSEESYYSEIEIEFLKNGEIVDLYAIIIYLDGKLQSEAQQILDYTIQDLKIILRDYYGKN